MSFKMTGEARTLLVYNLSAETNEFIGAGEVYIQPYTGLPAHCVNIRPPEVTAGKVPVFNFETASWEVTEDHRGKTVYDIETGQEIYISALGALPEKVTSIAPDGEFYKWNGRSWVKDADAESSAQRRESEATKNSLMQTANEKILPLQDAIDLDISTEEEKELLVAWKQYRVLLNRININTAPDIEWPMQP